MEPREQAKLHQLGFDVVAVYNVDQVKSVSDVPLRDLFAMNAPEWVEGNPTWGEIQKFMGIYKEGRDIGEWQPAMTLAYKVAKRYEWADAMIKGRGRE